MEMQYPTQKLMQKNFIGELTPVLTEGSLSAALDCTVPSAVKISIIVQDELGRSCWEKSFELPAGRSTLDLDFSNLKKGNFTAWVDVAGETVIRSFSVEETATNGLFGRLRQLWS